MCCSLLKLKFKLQVIHIFGLKITICSHYINDFCVLLYGRGIVCYFVLLGTSFHFLFIHISLGEFKSRILCSVVICLEMKCRRKIRCQNFHMYSQTVSRAWNNVYPHFNEIIRELKLGSVYQIDLNEFTKHERVTMKSYMSMWSEVSIQIQIHLIYDCWILEAKAISSTGLWHANWNGRQMKNEKSVKWVPSKYVVPL